MTIYTITTLRVTDRNKLEQELTPAALIAHATHGVECLARTDDHERITGNSGLGADQRIVILKFRDREHLDQWYNSPEMKNVLEIMGQCTDTHSITAVPGYEMPPQQQQQEQRSEAPVTEPAAE